MTHLWWGLWLWQGGYLPCGGHTRSLPTPFLRCRSSGIWPSRVSLSRQNLGLPTPFLPEGPTSVLMEQKALVVNFPVPH